MTLLNLKVISSEPATDRIRRITLGSSTDAPLPPFEPGAHIKIALPDGGERAYSLVAFAPEEARTPTRYVLGVLLEAKSAGGSRHMHGLRPGDVVSAAPPQNDFALAPDGGAALLIAGGVGVTPLISMAAALVASGRPFEIRYAARSRSQLAFAAELGAICGDRLTLHCDDEPETRFDLAATIAASAPERQIYVCGPKGMIEAVREAALARGFAKERIRFELFQNPGAPAGGDTVDGAFEVEVKSTGQVVEVPADKTIIEALEAAGVDLIYDCQRGDCGICRTEVLDGAPDHRDVVLTDAEKAFEFGHADLRLAREVEAAGVGSLAQRRRCAAEGGRRWEDTRTIRRLSQRWFGRERSIATPMSTERSSSSK